MLNQGDTRQRTATPEATAVDMASVAGLASFSRSRASSAAPSEPARASTASGVGPSAQGPPGLGVGMARALSGDEKALERDDLLAAIRHAITDGDDSDPRIVQVCRA